MLDIRKGIPCLLRKPYAEKQKKKRIISIVYYYYVALRKKHKQKKNKKHEAKVCICMYRNIY